MHFIIRICINDSGRIFTIDCGDNYNIALVKKIIEQEEGIPKDKQRLFYGGYVLEDDKFINFYSIVEGSTVWLQKNIMKIYVKNTVEKKISKHTVDETMLIEKLKIKIFNEEDISPDQQRLFYGGEFLDNKKMLKDYDIKNESTIILHKNKLEIKIKI